MVVGFELGGWFELILVCMKNIGRNSIFFVCLGFVG